MEWPGAGMNGARFTRALFANYRTLFSPSDACSVIPLLTTFEVVRERGFGPVTCIPRSCGALADYQGVDVSGAFAGLDGLQMSRQPGSEARNSLGCPSYRVFVMCITHGSAAALPAKTKSHRWSLPRG